MTLINFAHYELKTTSMKGTVGTNISRIILLLLVVMEAGVFMALRSMTMINPWIVATGAVVAAFPAAMACAARSKRIIPFRQLAMRCGAWLVIISPIMAGTFYGLNYVGRDTDDAIAVPAVVERKYYETRNRTRRVGRGRYAPTGEKYQVYYADIRLEGGHLTTVPLSGSDVLRVKAGQHLTATVATGAFGVPVVVTKDIFKKRNISPSH